MNDGPPPAAAIPSTNSTAPPASGASAAAGASPPAHAPPPAAHPSPITTLVALTSQGLLKPPVAPAVAACLDLDDSELIVADLVEEILQRSQDVLFEKHISSQVLPYAIQYAKDTVLKLAMWEFFDEDRVNPSDAMWSPDQEPDPLPFDSWARGVLSPLLPTTAAATKHVPPTNATATSSVTSLDLTDPNSAHVPTLTLIPGLPAHKPIVRWNSTAGSQDVYDSLQIDIAPAASTSPSGRTKLATTDAAPSPNPSVSPVPFASPKAPVAAAGVASGRMRQDSLMQADEDQPDATNKSTRATSKSPVRPKGGEAREKVRSPARRLVQQAS